jgi:hypothetical protein
MTCESCGAPDAVPGGYCSRCGHFNPVPAALAPAGPEPPALPPAPAAPNSAVVQVVFGGCAGIIVGSILGGVLLLVPMMLTGLNGNAGGLGDRSVGLVWLAESAGLLAAIVFFALPVAKRVPPFVRALAIGAAFVALGGLSICDTIALSQLFVQPHKYAPVYRHYATPRPFTRVLR